LFLQLNPVVTTLCLLDKFCILHGKISSNLVGMELIFNKWGWNFFFIFSFVGRQKFYRFVRGYLCAKYPLTNPQSAPQTAVCLIPLYGLYLCLRAAEDILSLSSHEPYGATASVPSLFFVNPAVIKKWGQSRFPHSEGAPATEESVFL